jgi:Lon protease-like protein
MSESLDKVSGIKHLPLFPLPLVLLPNEFLPLHIFEDRYKQMLKDVLEEQKLFGCRNSRKSDHARRTRKFAHDGRCTVSAR